MVRRPICLTNEGFAEEMTSADMQTFILANMRYEIELLGDRDHVNLVFRLPGGEKFVPGTLRVYFNGRREGLLNDYSVSESGGSGTGFDTVTFLHSSMAPYPDERVLADYFST